MTDDTADSLREMAQHRGLKLVKSRRRKPGTGDFGKYGLTDEQGKPLLGIGDEGLTASAEDIEGFLRAGAARTWQQSAKIVPDRPAPLSEPRREEGPEALPLPRRLRRDGDRSRGDQRPKTSSSRSSLKSEPEAKGKPARTLSGREAAARGEADPRTSKANPRGMPVLPKPEPVEVGPELVLRLAKPGDAAGLAKLLALLSGPSPSENDVARDIAALRKAGAGIHVAEFGRLVGCVGWAVVATPHRGPVGRITLLVVDEAHRRQGIGTRLLAQAEVALAKKGCALVEVMSDIEIKNSHNFFRTLNFDQTSYRFARKIAL